MSSFTDTRMSLLTDTRNRQAAYLASQSDAQLKEWGKVLETALDSFLSGDLTTEKGRNQFCADMAKQMIAEPPIALAPFADLRSLKRYPVGNGVSACRVKITPYAENLGHGYTGEWKANVWAQADEDSFSELVGTVSDVLPITKDILCSMVVEGDSCHVLLNRLPLAEDYLNQESIRANFSTLTNGGPVILEEDVVLGSSVYCRPVAFDGVFSRREQAANSFLAVTNLSAWLREDLMLRSDRMELPELSLGLSLTSEGTGYFTVQTSKPLSNTELCVLNQTFSDVLSSDETTRADSWAQLAEKSAVFLRNPGNALTKAIPNETLVPVIQGMDLEQGSGSSMPVLTEADLVGLDDPSLEL